ncbi:AMP-binding protein [Ketobacter sp.]|uniref:AMP-binding protein n=1 Tax=Ketobacter sp. TaxID=2083498 RepID=UPI000F26350D|nr:AMP-binding protein [Ketobacter sp.]RLU00322.1 MAG: AMP-dependent synthetase [Ketobacter sp.]
MILMPSYRNLVDMLTQRAHSSGRAVYANFLNSDGELAEQLTFRELNQAACQIGASLREQGLAGRTVLLLFLPGLDYIRAFFGCLYAGAIPVPAYPPTGTKDLQRLGKIALDCQAGAILSNSGLLPQVTGWQSGLGVTWDVPRICVDHLLWTDTPEAFVPFQAQPDDVAFLQYTSGSTGRPKGVVVSHANLLANFAQILQGFLRDHPMVDWLEELRSVCWLPPFHDMGLIGGILTPIFAGAQVTLMAPMTFLRRPDVWLKALSVQRAHISGGPNFAYDYCLQKVTDAQLKHLDLSCWKVAYNGAEPIQADVLQRFSARFAGCGFNRNAFFPCYGLAEASLFVSGAQGGRGARTLAADQFALQQGRFVAPGSKSVDPHQDLVSSGRIAEGTAVRIVQPDTRLPCAEGEVGEIWVHGPSVAQGYWGKPALSESTFQARIAREHSSQEHSSQAHPSQAFLRTGDLGFRWQDQLYVTGRIKELIIVAGRNLYPQDIEQTVQASHEDFRRRGGAAFGLPGSGREQLVILQELQRNGNCNNDLAVTAAMAARAVAARHGVLPTVVVLLPLNALPRTSSGKLQRVEARQRYQDGTLKSLHVWRSGSHREPRKVEPERHAGTEVLMHLDWQEALCLDVQLWVAEKLDVELHHVSLDATFADMGMDSVEAVELVERLQDRIGRPIPVIEMLRYPTVRVLIEHLAEERRQHELLRQECEETFDLGVE